MQILECRCLGDPITDVAAPTSVRLRTEAAISLQGEIARLLSRAARDCLAARRIRRLQVAVLPNVDRRVPR